MATQDWTPVILSGKEACAAKIQKEKAAAPVQQKKQVSQETARLFKLDGASDEAPILSELTPSKALQLAIQQGRAAKGWKRKDLANRCDLKENIIADYEQGKGIVKSVELAKISRALGVSLPKA